MLHFIPAWYQQNNWRENEQYWYARRMKTEFDDTVKHIQLFQRNKTYPFQIMLLSYAPNFRHFLHRQSVFHAPYWSCFDAIQEVKRKKIKMFSVHNLNWPKHIEFVFSNFAMIALLDGKKYAQVEYGEDGNPIQVDIYKEEQISRRNIYDDRGFVSGTIIYDAGGAVYQDYLTDKGVWKIREYMNDRHVEVNPKSNTYLLEHDGAEHTKTFARNSYDNMGQVIQEVLTSYLELLDSNDMFCVAMHELHTEVLRKALERKKLILSFFGERYNMDAHADDLNMIKNADYVIADSRENYELIQRKTENEVTHITNITPFDSRVDFGISQQMNVQKILVPVDGMDDGRFAELIKQLGLYLSTNENARIHLFTRLADYDRKRILLERAAACLRDAGLESGWASEERANNESEIKLDGEETVPVKFFVEQCVDELSVSKCIRLQRIVVDMRKNTEVYLRILGISVGIPQIVSGSTEFVDDGKNGRILGDMVELPDVLAYYLESLTNWNEAMVYSYELGKKYTTGILIEKWKEVIDFVGNDSSSSAGNGRLE